MSGDNIFHGIPLGIFAVFCDIYSLMIINSKEYKIQPFLTISTLIGSKKYKNASEMQKTLKNCICYSQSRNSTANSTINNSSI